MVNKSYELIRINMSITYYRYNITMNCNLNGPSMLKFFNKELIHSYYSLSYYDYEKRNTKVVHYLKKSLYKL